MTLLGYKREEGNALYYPSPTIENPEYFAIVNPGQGTTKKIIGRQALFSMRFKFFLDNVFNSKGRIPLIDINSDKMYFISSVDIVLFIKKLSRGEIQILNQQEEIYEATFKIKKTGKFYGLELATNEDIALISNILPINITE